jgi:hypothetical protein
MLLLSVGGKYNLSRSIALAVCPASYQDNEGDSSEPGQANGQKHSELMSRHFPGSGIGVPYAHARCVRNSRNTVLLGRAARGTGALSYFDGSASAASTKTSRLVCHQW